MRDGLLLQEAQLVAAKYDAVKTLLTVADDEDNRALFTEAFAVLTSYHILAARNSPEALNFVKHVKPNLFIFDSRLPDMNGLELYDQLHATPALEAIPAIIITSLTSADVRHEIESRKLKRLDKPFDLDGFLEPIKQALGVVHLEMPGTIPTEDD